MKAFNWSQRQLLQRRTKVFMVLLTQSDTTDWQSKIEEKQTSHTVCRGQTQIQRSLGKGMKGSLLTSCPGISQFITVTSVRCWSHKRPLCTNSINNALSSKGDMQPSFHPPASRRDLEKEYFYKVWKPSTFKICLLYTNRHGFTS